MAQVDAEQNVSHQGTIVEEATSESLSEKGNTALFRNHKKVEAPFQKTSKMFMNRKKHNKVLNNISTRDICMNIH